MDPSEGFGEYLMGLALAPRTIITYEHKVDHAETWFARQGKALTEATARDLFMYAAEMGDSASTLGQFRSALRHYYRWHGQTPHRADAVRVPPAPEMVCRAFTDDEAERLVEVATGWYPQGTAVLFGMYLALRRSEIAMAQWSRFDRTFEWYTAFGKNSRTRTIAVPSEFTEEIRSVRRTDRNWIFPGREGMRPYANPATIWQWTREVANAAGIEGFQPHRMRHHALAIANDVTKNLRAVQSFAGHAKPTTTAGYTRTRETEMREVAAAVTYRKRRGLVSSESGEEGGDRPAGDEPGTHERE